jgi:hypothetical protein
MNDKENKELLADTLIQRGKIKIFSTEFPEEIWMEIENRQREFHYYIYMNNEQINGGICQEGDALDAITHSLEMFQEELDELIKTRKKEVIGALLKIEPPKELCCGDIWVNIDYLPKYQEGVFVQVEAKELDNGEFSDDIFCFYGYKNIKNEDGTIGSDYSNTVFAFEATEDEIYKISSVNKNLDTQKEICDAPMQISKLAASGSVQQENLK